MEINLEKSGISYTEGDDLHLYLAVVRLENGNGDLITVLANDEFMAGVLAKHLCKRVMFVSKFTDQLEKIKTVLEEGERIKHYND